MCRALSPSLPARPPAPPLPPRTRPATRGWFEPLGRQTRADGSKTSYFTREVDEQTKALLDAQKAPKRISVGAAPPPATAQPSAGAGSAWNTGGTWEEKDLTEWSKGELESRLKAACAEHGGVQVKVSKAKDVEGSASVVASRGTVRHLYEFSFELEYKAYTAPAEAAPADADADADADGDDADGGDGGGGDGGGGGGTAKKSVCRGMLKYAEVSSSKEAGNVVVGDVEHTFKSAPSAERRSAALAAVDALKDAVKAALATFDADFRAAKRL